MKFTVTTLAGVWVVKTKPILDNRGFFTRTYCKQEFASIDIEEDFVQINHVLNIKKGTIRGLHYQIPPYSEIKYVSCILGAIFDVVVDLRKNSPTFLKHFCIELSSANSLGLIVPSGCAHGYQVLEDNTSLLYLHSSPYQPGFESGLKYDDPALGINWPLEVSNISDRDKNFNFIDYTFKSIQL